jgi:hypothetical protein
MRARKKIQWIRKDGVYLKAVSGKTVGESERLEILESRSQY